MMVSDYQEKQELTLPLAVPADEEFCYPSSVLTDELKAKVKTTMNHPALIIPARRTAELRKSLSHILMNRPKMKDVYALLPKDFSEGRDSNAERKLVLKMCNKDGEDIYNQVQELLSEEGIRKSVHEVVIGYDHYTVEQILSLILPKHCNEIPSSFEVVGTLAHMNLRPESLPFKFIIGRVILDKNKSLKLVVNKVGTIQNEFRTFPMEILAENRKSTSNPDGALEHELKLEVEVKEDGCRFQLDFAKVYWNSRLQNEHRRLVHLIAGKPRETNVKKRSSKKGEKTKGNKSEAADTMSSSKIIVADACAGIGPFVIPLASQYSHVEVHANDLNPESIKYLEKNAKINHCSPNKLKIYNMDGRDFLRRLDKEGVEYDHVLMNLPAIAPEFLNVFSGWKGNYSARPMIHVHCFGGKGDGAHDEAIERCSRALGCGLDKCRHNVSVHIVRDVSPKKNMLCVSFRLPESVQDLKQIESFEKILSEKKEDADSIPPKKRARCD